MAKADPRIEIQRELHNATRRPMSKKGGEPKRVKWNREAAVLAEQRAIRILAENEFSPFIEDAGLYFDGTYMAHVIRTENFNSHVVAAWIDGEDTTALILKQFHSSHEKWQEQHG